MYIVRRELSSDEKLANVCTLKCENAVTAVLSVRFNLSNISHLMLIRPTEIGMAWYKYNPHCSLKLSPGGKVTSNKV